MKKLFPLIFLLAACSAGKKRQESFPVLTVSDNEWATYEGRWLTREGVYRIELSLKSGPFGVDSYYKLSESFESSNHSNSSIGYGLYSTGYEFGDKELNICLHNVNTNEFMYFRFKKSQNMGMPYEMFFISRGNDELLPSDDSLVPITADRRYTLHRRSKLFTVEGYITFEQDSSAFFERNTREYWKVTDLGEFDELRLKYKALAKEEHEGIYLKALAYSIPDTSSQIGQDALVIKQIKNVGKDPD